MNTHRIAPLAALATLALAIVQPTAAAAQDDEETPFDVGKLFFQLNDTDGDLGIHMLLDGDPWARVTVEDPDGRRLLAVRPRGRLRQQGLTELKFESAEPTFDELAAEEFFARFPEGAYEIEGVTLDGEVLDSEVVITHVLPAPPENLMVSGMAAPEDCDEGVVPMVAGPVVLSWDPVTMSHPELGRAGDIEVTRYELAVEVDDTELKLEVTLPPDVTALGVPAGFVAQGEEFKFQVLVTDAGGNETSSESCFIVP
jgi:hypothetical protein